MMVVSRQWRRWIVLGTFLGLSGGVLAGCAGDGATLPDGEGVSQARTIRIIKENIDKAKDLRTKGDYGNAAKVLSQILLVEPDNPEILGEYGKVLTEQGRTADAVAYFNRVIMLNGGDWTIYSALGVALDANGKSDEARNAYERALKLKPNEKIVLNNYALSRLLAGDVTGAQTLIAQAADGAHDPKIARNYAMIQSLTGLPKHMPAATGVNAAPALAPAPEVPQSPTQRVPKSLPPQPDISAPAVLQIPPPHPISTVSAPKETAAAIAPPAPVEAQALAPTPATEKNKTKSQRPSGSDFSPADR